MSLCKGEISAFLKMYEETQQAVVGCKREPLTEVRVCAGEIQLCETHSSDGHTIVKGSCVEDVGK